VFWVGSFKYDEVWRDMVFHQKVQCYHHIWIYLCLYVWTHHLCIHLNLILAAVGVCVGVWGMGVCGGVWRCVCVGGGQGTGSNWPHLLADW